MRALLLQHGVHRCIHSRDVEEVYYQLQEVSVCHVVAI